MKHDCGAGARPPPPLSSLSGRHSRKRVAARKLTAPPVCPRIPDTCKVRDKMKYSGTKEAVKSAFVGISVNINATDMSEITSDIITEACNKV